MRIGELAALTGLSASAIRYYESVGLLPEPNRVSGKRVYDERTLNQIAFVQFARQAGFTVDEVRTLTKNSKKSASLSPRLRRLAAAKVKEIEVAIRHAQLMRKLLDTALTCSCLDPEECGRRIRAVTK